MNRWYPEALKEFKIVTVFDLLLEYIEEGRIELDKSIHEIPTAYHDPCNYGRKSLKAFGKAYFEEGRAVAKACCNDVRELNPNRNGAYCCGAGGGAWALPYSDERVYYGRTKARQITESGAELVVAPCHNCRDQIMKSLNKEYDLGVEVKYLWELVADSLIMPSKQ
ncbi:MAG: Fe-S oxidoreductase [Desulforhopalus sp.]